MTSMKTEKVVARWWASGKVNRRERRQAETGEKMQEARKTVWHQDDRGWMSTKLKNEGGRAGPKDSQTRRRAGGGQFDRMKMSD